MHFHRISTLVLSDAECNEKFAEMKPSHKQNFCYSRLVEIALGSQGKGKRVPLPKCVVDGFREKYPNELGQAHTGFKEAQT